MSVQIDIIAQAEDAASAELRAATASAKALRTEIEVTTGSTSKATAATKELSAAQKLEATALGQSAKGFQDVIGKVTGFIGAATFAAGAIGGLVAGIASLIGNQRSLDVAIEETSKAIAAQATAATKLIGELNKSATAYLDLAAAKDADLASTLELERAAANRADVETELRGRIAGAEILIGIQEKQLEMETAALAGLRRRAEIEAQIGTLLDTGIVGTAERARREEQIAELEAVRQRRLAEIQRQQEAIARAMGDQVRAAESLEDKGRWWLPEGGSTTDVEPIRPRAPRPDPGADMAAAMAWEHQRFLDQQADREEEVRTYAQSLADAHAMGVADRKAAAEYAKAQHDAEVARLQAMRAEVDLISQTFANGLEPLGAWGTALSGVATQVASAASGLTSVGSAVAAGTASVVGGIAEQMESTEAYMALKAVEQLGLGFATMFTAPPQSVAHFTAAGILGIGAAVTAATGGGSRTGSSQMADSGPRQQQQGGMSATVQQAPIIVQASLLDGPGLTQAIAEGERRAAYSGYGSRAGAY